MANPTNTAKDKIREKLMTAGKNLLIMAVGGVVMIFLAWCIITMANAAGCSSSGGSDDYSGHYDRRFLQRQYQDAAVEKIERIQEESPINIAPAPNFHPSPSDKGKDERISELNEEAIAGETVESLVLDINPIEKEKSKKPQYQFLSYRLDNVCVSSIDDVIIKIYTNGSDGTCQMDIDMDYKSDYDQLKVGGVYNIAGTLNPVSCRLCRCVIME